MTPIHSFVRRHAALASTLTLASALQGLGACTGDDGDADDGASTSSSGETSASTGTTDGGSDDAAGSSSSGSGVGSSDGSDTGTSAGSDSGSDSGSTGADSGSTGAAGIAIAGEWVDDFGGSHSITDETWTQTYGPDSFGYTFASYDNDGGVVIASSDDDGTWSRFDWTFVDQTLWYCQTGFALPTQQDAEQTPAADPSDPGSGGCGGFSWSRLSPA